jgi:hypothetical protein
MHLRITRETSRSRSGDTEIYYLREVPHVPGRTIQATGLTLEAALWTARRLSGVVRVDLPQESG